MPPPYLPHASPIKDWHGANGGEATYPPSEDPGVLRIRTLCTQQLALTLTRTRTRTLALARTLTLTLTLTRRGVRRAHARLL